MPSKKNALSEEQREYLKVITEENKKIWDFFKDGAFESLCDNKNVKLDVKVKKNFLPLLQTQADSEEKIKNQEQFADWLEQQKKIEEYFHNINASDRELYNDSINDRYQYSRFIQVLGKENTETLDKFLKIYVSYEDAKKETAYISKKDERIAKVTDEVGDLYDNLLELNKDLSRLELIGNSVGMSVQWTAMRSALNETLAAGKECLDKENPDTNGSYRKWRGALRVLTLASLEYSIHKETQGKTKEGKDNLRYYAAKEIYRIVGDKFIDLNAVNIKDYVYPDTYSQKFANYDEQTNPILKQMRYLKELSDELHEIEGMSHRTSDQYKDLKKALDAFISDDNSPIKSLLDKDTMSDANKSAAAWEKYRNDMNNIRDLANAYLDHKMVKNDGSKGSLARINAVGRLLDYTEDLKEAYDIDVEKIKEEEKKKLEEAEAPAKIKKNKEEFKELCKEGRKKLKKMIHPDGGTISTEEFNKNKDYIRYTCYVLCTEQAYECAVQHNLNDEEIVKMVEAGRGRDFALNLKFFDALPNNVIGSWFSEKNITIENVELLLKHTEIIGLKAFTNTPEEVKKDIAERRKSSVHKKHHENNEVNNKEQENKQASSDDSPSFSL